MQPPVNYPETHKFNLKNCPKYVAQIYPKTHRQAKSERER